MVLAKATLFSFSSNFLFYLEIVFLKFENELFYLILCFFSNSQNGKKSLICDENDYLYRISSHSENKTRSYYRCSEEKCPARITTIFGSPEIVKKLHKHSHAPKKNQIHTCQICFMAFTRPGHLLAHTNSVHKGLKEYQCESCDRDFSHTARPWTSLNHHMKQVHSTFEQPKQENVENQDIKPFGVLENKLDPSDISTKIESDFGPLDASLRGMNLTLG